MEIRNRVTGSFDLEGNSRSSQHDAPVDMQSWSTLSKFEPVATPDAPGADDFAPVTNYRRKGQIGGFEEDREDKKTSRFWHRDIEIPEIWDGPHFQNRLIYAYKTLAYAPSPKHSRPASYGSSWPQYSYKFEDLVAQADAEDEQLKADRNRRNFVRPVPTREQLTQMDTLFNTVYAFRKTHQEGCSMVLTWAHGRYRKVNMDIVASRFSVSKPTLYRKIEEVSSLCSDLLNYKTVRPW